MKVTKKPKRVVVRHKETVCEQSSYYCPTCHTTFIGAGISRRISRFRCTCGQELIVDTHTPQKAKSK